MAVLCLFPFAAGCGADPGSANSSAPPQTSDPQPDDGQTSEEQAIAGVEGAHRPSLDVWRAHLQQQWGRGVRYDWTARPGADGEWEVKLVISDAEGPRMSGRWAVAAPVGEEPTADEVQDWLRAHDGGEARPLDRGARRLVGLPPANGHAAGTVRLPVSLMGETDPGRLLAGVLPAASAPLVGADGVDYAMLRGLALARGDSDTDLASLNLRLDGIRFVTQGAAPDARPMQQRGVLDALLERGPQQAVITWTGVPASATLDELERLAPREVALPAR